MRTPKNKLGRGVMQVFPLLAAALALIVPVTLGGNNGHWSLKTTIICLSLGTLALIFLIKSLTKLKGLGEGKERQILGIILLVHVLSIFFFFPPDFVIDDKPVLTLDHAIHYYQAESTREVFPQKFRLDHYDPFFMAGYPAGSVFDLDMKGAELFCSLVRVINAARALKLFLMICYISMVFTIYRGSRLLGFSFRESILGLLSFLVFWHFGRPYASDFRFAGMFSFIFVSHLSFYVGGLFKKFLAEGRWRVFFMLGPVSFFVHPTAVVILPAVFIAVAIIERRHITFKRAAEFVLWCAAVLAVNAIWLIPFFSNIKYKTSSTAYFQLQGAGDALSLLLRIECVPALALAILSAAGVFLSIRVKRINRILPPALGAAAMFVIASYGHLIPGVNQMEPGRFFLTMFFFLPPLAGSAVSRIFGYIGKKRFLPETVQSVLFIMLIVLPLWGGFVAARTRHKHRITTKTTAAVAGLVEVLRNNSYENGRLMIEDGPARLYGNFQLPGLLPALTGVEQIGGPYPNTFLDHHYASFSNEGAFGKKLSAYSPDEFLEMLERYNVAAVLSATKKSTVFLGKLGILERTWTDGQYVLWRVPYVCSPAIIKNDEARVDVEARLDEIHVSVQGVLNEFILKYHWVDALNVTGRAEIYPVGVGSDPVPFIGIKPNGMKNIVIKYK